MTIELLMPEEMARVDRLAIAAGPHDGMGLMRRAGAAVAALILERFPATAGVDVLCGPGNNGGDGYVIAELLHRAGVDVAVYRQDYPRQGSDAAQAALECEVLSQPLASFRATRERLVVDALFGAGLSRAVDGETLSAIKRTAEAGVAVVAVDLPSGVSGASGEILGAAFDAEMTVTFARRKPGHLLLPGRLRCGEVIVADIGITDRVIAEVGASCFVNEPALWRASFPAPSIDVHKYSRGHVGVFSGHATATGAARLSAMAAARIGAGAVTVISPPEALAANAAHLTSIMLKATETLEDVLALFEARRPEALVYGPGLSPEPETGQFLLQLLDRDPKIAAAVIDASALTSLAHEPDLVRAPFGGRSAQLVITPHEGEFARLFPDIESHTLPSKLDRARLAAERSDAVVVYKGPDTVIAEPSGRAAINANGTPLLATAGSGDVLSGFIAGLLAQGMPPFEAACAAVWLHAEAARGFGPGLIAEDLPLALPPILGVLA